jgi:hypothetical protein
MPLASSVSMIDSFVRVFRNYATKERLRRSSRARASEVLLFTPLLSTSGQSSVNAFTVHGFEHGKVSRRYELQRASGEWQSAGPQPNA